MKDTATPGAPEGDAEDFGPFVDDDDYCYRCDSRGTILVCVDDMCRGAGECMHGDGEIICPDCKGACGDW